MASAAVSVRERFVVATSGQILMAAHTRDGVRIPRGMTHTTGILERRLAGVLVAEIELRWHRRQQVSQSPGVV